MKVKHIRLKSTLIQTTKMKVEFWQNRLLVMKRMRTMVLITIWHVRVTVREERLEKHFDFIYIFILIWSPIDFQLRLNNFFYKR
jgi:hypothetical protein